MSHYQDGYDRGYQDGLAGTHRGNTTIIDMFLPPDPDEVQVWEDGYEAGYQQGEKEQSR